MVLCLGTTVVLLLLTQIKVKIIKYIFPYRGFGKRMTVGHFTIKERKWRQDYSKIVTCMYIRESAEEEVDFSD